MTLQHRTRPESRFDRHVSQVGFSPPSRVSVSGEPDDWYRPAGDEFPTGISVVILTLNEEVNLRYALASVSGADDVVILDSGSSDGTVEIAESANARVFHRPFTTSSEQRQWALERIPFRNQWIFVLDADEWVPQCLARELDRTISTADETGLAGAWLRTRFVYEGRWVPRASMYPTWTMRLLKLGAVRYEPRAINAHPVASGPTSRLHHDLIHQDRKSLSIRMRKIERVARLEALELSKVRSAPLASMRAAATGRRRLKIAFSLLPSRASLLFVFLLLRGAFREGAPGWHLAQERYWQQWLTSRYIREVAHNDSPPMAAVGELPAERS